jgi:hypothetical protein
MCTRTSIHIYKESLYVCTRTPYTCIHEHPIDKNNNILLCVYIYIYIRTPVHIYKKNPFICTKTPYTYICTYIYIYTRTYTYIQTCCLHMYKTPYTYIQGHRTRIYKNTLHIYTRIPYTYIQEHSIHIYKNTLHMYARTSYTYLQEHPTHVCKNTLYIFTRTLYTYIQEHPIHIYKPHLRISCTSPLSLPSYSMYVTCLGATNRRKPSVPVEVYSVFSLEILIRYFCHRNSHISLVQAFVYVISPASGRWTRSAEENTKDRRETRPCPIEDPKCRAAQRCVRAVIRPTTVFVLKLTSLTITNTLSQSETCSF